MLSCTEPNKALNKGWNFLKSVKDFNQFREQAEWIEARWVMASTFPADWLFNLFNQSPRSISSLSSIRMRNKKVSCEIQIPSSGGISWEPEEAAVCFTAVHMASSVWYNHWCLSLCEDHLVQISRTGVIYCRWCQRDMKRATLCPGPESVFWRLHSLINLPSINRHDSWGGSELKTLLNPN